MNKLIIATLLVALSGSANAADQTEAEKETYWLKEFRANPSDPDALVTLAQVREGRSKWQSAAAAWGMVRKQFGPDSSKAFDGRDQLTYAQLAEWWIGRLGAKQTRQRKPNTFERLEIERAWKRYKSNPKIAKLGRVDLDNDNIPELFYFVKDSAAKAAPTRELRVDKWQGKKYIYAWSSGELTPQAYSIIATKNWPRVILDYTVKGDINPTIKSLYSNSFTLIEIED